MSDFPTLTGFYKTLFLHIEPVSTISPAILAWIYPSATWFHHQLIPDGAPVPPSGFLDSRTRMAIWQLGNCYFLLGLISTLVFRAVRDALPKDPVAQEKILGASFAALAIADVTHIIATLVGLPPALRWSFWNWNAMTHGNVSFVVLLFWTRVAWFLGVGRTRYYYGQALKLKST